MFRRMISKKYRVHKPKLSSVNWTPKLSHKISCTPQHSNTGINKLSLYHFRFGKMFLLDRLHPLSRTFNIAQTLTVILHPFLLLDTRTLLPLSISIAHAHTACSPVLQWGFQFTNCCLMQFRKETADLYCSPIGKYDGLIKSSFNNKEPIHCSFQFNSN